MHHKSYQPLCVFVCIGEMSMYILLCMSGWKTEVGLNISFIFPFLFLILACLQTLKIVLTLTHSASSWIIGTYPQSVCYSSAENTNLNNKLFIHWAIFPSLITHSTLKLRNKEIHPLPSQKISLWQEREIQKNIETVNMLRQSTCHSCR